MNYEIKNNKIIIKDLSQFNIQHILECGQFFRYIKKENGYEIYSLDKCAIIISYEDKYEIQCEDINYFVNFFDLKTDYNIIKAKLLDINSYLNESINFGYGIRILNQNVFEMFVTFIISANNNIKRIQNSIFKLCEKFGDYKTTFYAFPTHKQLLKATVQDFVECGLGYRAQQLYNALRQIKDLNKLIFLNSDELSLKLQEFSGIGPKVADCIMLFGYNKTDVFPVDTWIEKAYNTMFNLKQTNRKLIRKSLVEKFKNLSGYAQQYLFYYKRSLK